MEDFKAKARQIMQTMSVLANNFNECCAGRDYKEAYITAKRFAAEFGALRDTLSTWTAEKKRDTPTPDGKAADGRE